MSFRKPALLALGLTLLVGCTSIPVKYDYDRQANWSSYRTYDWYAASPQAKQKAAGVDNPLMDRRVRQSVEKVLATRGYKQEKQAEPDFLVTYYPVYHNRSVVSATTLGGWGWGFRPFGVGVSTQFREVRNYKDGTIVLEVVDNKTKQLVWQGAGEGVITEEMDPREVDEQIEEAVKQILDRFPPPPSRH